MRWSCRPGSQNKGEGQFTMRLHVAAIAAVLGCAVSATVEAGTVYPINFNALASEAGTVVSQTLWYGPMMVRINDALVIGPGDPGYTGSIGVAPADNGFDVEVEDIPVGTMAIPFRLASLAISLAPTSAGDTAYFDVAGGPSRSDGPGWVISGPAPWTDTIEPVPYGPYVGAVLVFAGNTNEAQITGLTLEVGAEPSSVPEPAGWLLGLIGLTAIAGRSSCRRWASRPA